MATPPPIRVMIVEDSTVVRQLLHHIVAGDPRLSVAAAVASAEEAIAALPTARPDVISMDIRLPGIDGLEATRRIMAERPTPIVVVAGRVDQELDISMGALSAGALSVVEKPVGLSHADYAGVAEQIRTQLRIMSEVPVVRRRLSRPPPASRPTAPAAAAAAAAAVRPRLIAACASTGGPQALSALLNALPAILPAPMLLVQHMGAPFMAGFVRWLDGVAPQQVVEAVDGAMPRPGAVHVAPGDRHLRVDRAGRMRIGDDAPVRGQRPAATVLLASAAEALGAAACGLVLTGMGEDGAVGVRALTTAGAAVFAEDETTAIVYGMPAAAVREGAAAVPLPSIAPQLMRLFEGGRT